MSGVYSARFGPPLDETQRFAVNVNTNESNPERFDPELRHRLQQLDGDMIVPNLNALVVEAGTANLCDGDQLS